MNKVFLTCVVASLFLACSKKDIQKWVNKPGPKPSVPCRVDSIYPVDKGDIMYHSWIAVGVHYNGQGYPAVVNYNIQSLSPAIHQFSVYYKYDSKNRLIEVDPLEVDPVQMELESLTPVLPHKFVYQGNSQLPIRDSILSDTFFGVADGAAYQVFTVKVEDLYYDAQGRINRVVSRRTFQNTRYDQVEQSNYEYKYSYDAKGNRQGVIDEYGNIPPTVTYTNKPSLFSLHPVWQLVHKNWSENAVNETVQTYNSKGLPTKANLNETRFLQTKSLNENNPFLNITYTCY